MILYYCLLVSLSYGSNDSQGTSIYPSSPVTLISSTPSGCIVEVSPGEDEVFVLVAVPPQGKVKCSGGEVVNQNMWIRRHRIARIQVEPYKYGNRRVEIRWEAGKGILGLPEKTPFEDILRRHIVNYETAKYWVRACNPPFSIKIDQSNCKLLTDQEGIYRVDYEDISYIVPEITAVDPRTIKLTHCDLELPMVVKGEEDGVFNPGDWFEFYANRMQGKSTYLNLYSDTNIYWLSWGQSYGARLVKESGAPGDAELTDSFQFKIHFEQDSIYRLFKYFADTLDPWFWAQFSSERAFYLKVPDPAQSGSCSLRIEIRATADSAGYCEVYLNYNLLGEMNYYAQQGMPVVFETSFSQSMLKDSSILVLKPSRGNIYLNSVELTYFRLYKAQGGEIKFTALEPYTYKFKIDGFTNPGIRVWKIGTSVLVDGKIEYNDTLSTYSYTFEDTYEESTFYVAQTHILKPQGIRRSESNLKSPLNRADYIIITNQELYDCGASYASWKQSKGFTCKVVKVQEIYDEFNFGLADPTVIQNFLRYAFEVWSLPPVYVLLLGDASYDHRDILKFNEDIVPSRELHDWYVVLIPSDNLHACISGDDPIPDLFIARLPVKNSHEFNIAFNKLQRYEDEQWLGDWRKNLIFASMESFENLIGITERVIAEYVPKEFEVKRVYYPHRSQLELVDAINKGASLLSYIGHSGASDWSGGLLSAETIPSLMNIDRLPFISVFGCYNGMFDRAGEEYIGELFIKCPGGGIAYWGGSGALYIGEEQIVEGPIEALYTNRVNTPGSLGLEGIIKCFKANRDPKTVLQQILLGDPSTPIYTPQSGMELTVIPPSLHPGDSATIFGKLSSLSNGTAILTIYTSDTTQFKKIGVPINNGNFETAFRLPDTVVEGDGKIMCYAWIDTADFVGLTKFSIIKSNIYPIYVIPETPTSRDSVLIRAKAFDDAGINWVRCNWGVNPPPWNVIEMELDTGGYFVTKSPIPPQVPGATVTFKIELQNWNNELFSVPSSYKVLSLPDLFVYSMHELEGTSHVRISGEILNSGEEPTDSFEVVFYAITTSSDTILLAKDTLALNGKESAIASAQWNLKQGKAFIIIDPNNVVPESNEGNNITPAYDIPVSLFNVTTQFGTDGWVSSLDTRFRCKIDTNSIQEPTVLELKDTLSGHLARFRVRALELLQPIEIMLFPDSFYHGLSIYRWCPDYNRWLLISSDTIGATKKLGIFSLIKCEDTLAPKIKLSIQDDDTFYTSGQSLPLKIEGIISDESGIDIVDRKLTITCNDDTLTDSLYSYPTESASLYGVPLVLRKTFAFGDYTLCFIAYDFHGNRAEKRVTIHIKSEFAPVDKYCWGNYPNPVRGERTKFYFEFSDVPDEFRMQLYTVSGRLLRTFYPNPDKKIEFYWDLQAKGNPCANGVYFYRVFAKKGDKKITRILKLAILK